MTLLQLVLKKSQILTPRPVCKICFKEIKRKSILTFFTKNPPLCEDCFDSLNYSFVHSTFEGYQIMSLAPYAPPLSKLLIRYKENLDVELSSVFLSYYCPYLKLKYAGFVIVLAPSSASKIEKREFNHLELIFKNIGLPILNILTKSEGKEQKKNSARERMKVSKLIHIQNQGQICGKKILLVDDVITTGSTLKACLNLLEKGKPKCIKILTIMHGAPLNQYTR